MGVPFTAAHGSVRFSLSRYNTEAEMDYVIEHMPRIVERLRALSPFTAENSCDRVWSGTALEHAHDPKP
jgi:cysteine desulfurase